jgi:hypothetical protein
MIAPLSCLPALAGRAMLHCKIVIDDGRTLMAENDDGTMK